MRYKDLFILLPLIFILIFGCSSTEKCKNDVDCPKEHKCINERCYPRAFTPDPNAVDPNIGCSKDDECGICKRCSDGICVPTEGCDAGVVLLDGSRDIVLKDVEDVVDIEDVADVKDIEGDALLDEESLEDSKDYEDIGDTEQIEDVIMDAEDVALDVQDVSCDVNTTLIVTSRLPMGDLPRGTELTINGQGFDSECGTLSVTFTGDPRPARIKEVGSSYVKVVVPGFAEDGPITVRSYGQEAQLSIKIIRRMFYTDYGTLSDPGKKFFVLSFPNFLVYKNGAYDTNGDSPYPIMLDPYNLNILVVTRNTAGDGYIISAYDFATLDFIKQVTNNASKAIINAGLIDFEKEKIYLVSKNGYMYVHNMNTLELEKSIGVGVSLYGIDIDRVHNRILISGVFDNSLPPPDGPPMNYIGAIFVLDRDTYKPDSSEYVLFGNPSSIPRDVKYHSAEDLIFTIDYYNGYLHVYRGDNFQKAHEPIDLGGNSGPMKMAFGKDGKNLYIICNNSSRQTAEAYASIRVFEVATLLETSQPLNTHLVTSTSSDNSFNAVNLVYDEKDGYLIAVSNADNRIAVIDESSLEFLDKPQSPDNTKTPSTRGNFGIVVEDW